MHGVEDRRRASRRSDSARTTRRRRRQRDLDAAGDERDPGAAGERRLGDRDAHLPGAAVADEADGVDGLARCRRRSRRRGGPRGRRRAAARRAAGGRARIGLADRAVRRPPPTTASTMSRQLREPADARLARGERTRPRARRSGSRSRRGAGRRWSRVAGCVHMSPSIAGATTTGARVARHGRGDGVAGEPVGHRPQPARGRRRDDERVGGVGDHDVADPLVGQQRERRRSRPGGGERAAKVSGPTKRCAEGVSMTTTSAPSARSRRSSSTALYAAIEPRHAERDEPASRRPAAAVPSSVTAAPSSTGGPPLTSAWRIARPRSVRSGSMASTPSRPGPTAPPRGRR